MLSDYTWLSDSGAPGIQKDDDYYKIDVWFGYQHVRINLTYVQTLGDISLELWDDYGNSLAYSNTPTNDEFIDIIVPYDGIYYIRVFGINSGNSYNLIWESFFTDDYYEENDDIPSAYDLSFDEGRWLSQIMGRAGQFDDDYYRIQVDPTELRLIVFLRFYHLDGNIDLELRNSANLVVAGSTSITDNEFMDITLNASGTYFLRVYYANWGNPYDLLWEDRNQFIADDSYEPSGSPPPYTWLSNSPPNAGLGIQLDDDWYQVYIASGKNSLHVELVYSTTQGYIGMGVYDTSNNFLGGFSPTEQGEFFDISLSSGQTYKIKVYGENFGNVYDLWWGDYYWDTMSDDSYEYNNNNLEAFDLTTYQGLWLTEIYGSAYQFDDDWFKVYVEPGHERLFVDFFGEVDVEVFDSSLNFMNGSYSMYNDGLLDIILPGFGLYYILVSGYDNGNFYDLMVETLSPVGDDPYEINDHFSHPFIHIQNEQTWLSELEGMAVQGNEDWYAIEVTPGFLNLEVELLFNHSLGNIDMEVYLLDKPRDSANSGGHPGGPQETIIFEARGDSFNNSEYINVNVSRGGIYLIKVYGDNMENEYDMWWDDIKSWFSDDIYEENDISANAYDQMNQNMWLWGEYSESTSTPQLAVQYDEDWYKISVESGFEHLIVEMKYDIAEGMLGFEIYNVNLTEITGNFSMVDDAYIDHVLPSSGIYYIRVFGDNTGNVYNIRYFTSEDIPVDEIPGYDILILVVSIVGVSAVVIKIKRSKFKQQ